VDNIDEYTLPLVSLSLACADLRLQRSLNPAHTVRSRPRSQLFCASKPQLSFFTSALSLSRPLPRGPCPRHPSCILLDVSVLDFVGRIRAHQVGGTAAHFDFGGLCLAQLWSFDSDQANHEGDHQSAGGPSANDVRSTVGEAPRPPERTMGDGFAKEDCRDLP
jgi:hypothetical protein